MVANGRLILGGKSRISCQYNHEFEWNSANTSALVEQKNRNIRRDCGRKLLAGGASNGWPVPMFCSLYGTFCAPCAADHNALLEAPIRTTVDAEQNLENDHSISAHGDCYLRSHRRQWVG